MLHHQTIIANRAYTVSQTFADAHDDFRVFWQPVNPRTGKAWQASHEITRIQGKNAKAKAMRAWLMECNKARASG
jgi:hypothetical protein